MAKRKLLTIPASVTKNRRSHTIPLSQLAADILDGIPEDGPLLKYAGWGKAKARLDKASGVTGWTLHDLRRSYATYHAQLGTPPHIIEALLNHKSGIVSGVASVYNRYLYLDEMREAVRKFETWFETVIKADLPG